MAIGRTNAGAGGSGGVNFRVVGGTTQPTTPKENTIWVNTDVAIPSWAFSATEPESPVVGMVWISTGTSSDAQFNALKKMELEVYPTGAKQYVDGAWSAKEAWLYKGGTWVQWSGTEIVAFENGTFWAGSFGQSLNSSTYSRVEISGDNLAVICSGDGTVRAWLTEALDVTGYSKISFTLKVLSAKSSYKADIKVGVSGATNNNNFDASSMVTSWGDTDWSVLEIDISNLSGTKYIKITNTRYNETYSHSAYFQKIVVS